jgi:DNA ligase-1
MESPTKRRKKNDQKPSQLPERSIDFFFAKQNDKATQSTRFSETIQATASPVMGDGEQHLTDEELARKLHEEWTKEDTGSDIQRSTVEDKAPSPSSLALPADPREDCSC